MAEFLATTASNGPKVKDVEAVEQIIERYYFDPDFSVGTSYDHDTGNPSLFVYGYVWPEAWKLPVGVNREEFNPYEAELYEEGADGFVDFLKEIAPHLHEPLTVQAIGATKCRFPLSGCEWHIDPDSAEVEINDFRHWDTVEATTHQ